MLTSSGGSWLAMRRSRLELFLNGGRTGRRRRGHNKAFDLRRDENTQLNDQKTHKNHQHARGTRERWLACWVWEERGREVGTGSARVRSSSTWDLLFLLFCAHASCALPSAMENSKHFGAVAVPDYRFSSRATPSSGVCVMDSRGGFDASERCSGHLTRSAPSS